MYFTILFKYYFFIIFYNFFLIFLSISLSLSLSLNPTILLATTTGITKPKAITPNSQQPPHYQ